MNGSAALLREQVQARLGPHYDAGFHSVYRDKSDLEEHFPSLAGDIPRGAITEIAGAKSSGRTALLHSLLATATSGQELCTLLDANNTFDPTSAAAAGVRLSQLLWVRCGGNVEHALKAADMLSQGGGFGLIAIDLGDASDKALRRIPLVAWFRLRHTVENTRTALVVLAPRIPANSCSALKMELSRARSHWRGQSPYLLESLEIAAQRIQNHRAQDRRFTISR